MEHYHKTSLIRKFEIDPERFPAVVFESDDWGACERIPSAEIAEKNKELLGWWQPKLENIFELEELFSVIGKYIGIDNQKAVFTAFTSVGNPDYDAIRANGFTRYCDIGIDEGFPTPWNGDGIIEKMREGVRRGIWAPEYHSMLHHTSTKLWLELLRGEGPQNEYARKLFDLNCYLQDRHLPEYEKFTVREQREMIDTGMERFHRAFGYAPNAAVTSDAYPITVSLWAAAGINTVSLINCRVNSGEVVVYPRNKIQDLSYIAGWLKKRAIPLF
jgi:hypothetical protein